jgi:hypothetical protein
MVQKSGGACQPRCTRGSVNLGCALQPMPRLSSHPQLTRGFHSQDKETPELQYMALAKFRKALSRDGKRVLVQCLPVPFSLRNSAGNAWIPEGDLPDLSALPRRMHSNSLPPPFPNHRRSRRDAGLHPPLYRAGIARRSAYLSPKPLPFGTQKRSRQPAIHLSPGFDERLLDSVGFPREGEANPGNRVTSRRLDRSGEDVLVATPIDSLESPTQP